HDAVERLRQLGQAEVEDLDAPVLGQEEVVGLEVPVGDAAGVGGGEARAHLHRYLPGLAQRQRTAVEPGAQRLALQQLEHRVGSSVLGAHVVDRHDVRMLEGSDGSGLPLEAMQAVGTGRPVGGDDLDRYLTLQTRVAGAVNLAHSARPEWGDNLIRAETTSRRERHGTSLRPIVRSDGGTVHSSEASWRPRADALAAGAGLTASPSRERRSGWIRSRR